MILSFNANTIKKDKSCSPLNNLHTEKTKCEKFSIKVDVKSMKAYEPLPLTTFFYEEVTEPSWLKCSVV